MATRRIKGNACFTPPSPHRATTYFGGKALPKPWRKLPTPRKRAGQFDRPTKFRILEEYFFENPKKREHLSRGNIPEPPYGSSDIRLKKRIQMETRKKMPETQAPSLE